MSVYNLSHRLAKAIKESEEYEDFQKARKEILNKEKSIELLKDYQNHAWKINYLEQSDQEISEEDKEKFEKLQNLVEMNKPVQRFLRARGRFATMVNDIEDIIFGDLELELESEDEK
ncbi:MAG: YlbF family regulator [Bacillota bacterium]